ncbi:MAG: glycosyltransferase family 4 protein [Flavobacteriaceae bacterium]|nr:glycosyltransferase family 4 protein [Flavobacteriaceae bacterium]
MNKNKVILIFSKPRPFIEKDVLMLKKMGVHLIVISSPPKKSIFLFLWFRFREFFLVLFEIRSTRAIISWFNDYHTFLPFVLAKIAKIPRLILVGGFDAIANKDIRHGLFLNPNLRFYLGRLNYSYATQIWVVHKSLHLGCTRSSIQNGTQSGIQHFMPNLKTPIYEVPSGYSPEFWTYVKNKNPNSVLTVGYILDERTYLIKGIGLFVALAKLIPHMNFKIIGISAELASKHRFSDIQNLFHYPPIKHQELLSIYQESKFYFQGSMIEGLPNVLCEAMLCGCIPIGRAVFGIPDIIGNTGHLIEDPKNLDSVAEFITNADSTLGEKARQRIINNFSIKNRMMKFESFLSPNN